ncbi:hypothetical protein GUJ93_ZPchr0004g38229 [Zizania palustris]|uniref:Uncharacterized protein n=1 Tax=Zizania palustris TaxID=103762 RepID=A0A8J5VZK0_ZIZPA|nr:hypothetical protein GUJ93_ZPchr0004g38229 [Zizania palustris]
MDCIPRDYLLFSISWAAISKSFNMFYSTLHFLLLILGQALPPSMSSLLPWYLVPRDLRSCGNQRQIQDVLLFGHCSSDLSNRHRSTTCSVGSIRSALLSTQRPLRSHPGMEKAYLRRLMTAYGEGRESRRGGGGE